MQENALLKLRLHCLMFLIAHYVVYANIMFLSEPCFQLCSIHLRTQLLEMVCCAVEPWSAGPQQRFACPCQLEYGWGDQATWWWRLTWASTKWFEDKPKCRTVATDLIGVTGKSHLLLSFQICHLNSLLWLVWEADLEGDQTLQHLCQVPYLALVFLRLPTFCWGSAMCVYPGAPWGPLGLILPTLLSVWAKMLSISSPESFVWMHRSNRIQQPGIHGMSTHPGISTKKAVSYFIWISETSNNIWDFTQLETRKMFQMSGMFPFQVLVVPIHCVHGTAWDCHEKGRCKIRMKQYLSDRGSNLSIFLYSLHEIFSKDLFTSVHFDSNFSVYTTAGIFGVVTGKYYNSQEPQDLPY